MNRLHVLFACAALGGAAFAQAPVNDLCTLPISVQDGVNPGPPNGGSGSTYSSVGATNSAGSFPGCAAFNRDVWFAYVPPRTGIAKASTCTPPGFAAGTLSDTQIAAYMGGACATPEAPIACNDDSAQCGTNSIKSYIEFPVYAGFFYLIRVGSFSALGSGTFYLTITDPPFATFDSCLFAPTIPEGSYGPIQMNGVATTFGDPGCGISPAADVWYKHTTGSFTQPRELFAQTSGAMGDALTIYTGTGCGSLTQVACGAAAHTLAAQPNTTYWFRISAFMFSAGTDLDFYFSFEFQDTPPNDDCAAAHPVGNGVHPQPGDEAYFTNEGAFTTFESGAYCGTAYSGNDVWFSYVATTSGQLEISTLTPPGQTPGTLADTVLHVYDFCGGTTLACNDDWAGLRSKVEFPAVQGATYLIRVGSYDTFETEGTFHLTIRPRFTLTLTSPLGAGSFRLRDDYGAAFHAVYNCLTLQAGTYPNGPFFGIEPTLTEIALQVAYAQPPFFVGLDGNGAFQFDVAGLPPLTVYGVAIEFDLFGQVSGVSSPATVTIN